MPKQTALIILDGWGYREELTDNAVAAAQTPNFDRYWKENPHTLLQASGEFVGLPDGQMGNSEIGHTTIGAGTVIDTDLVRISKAARNGEFAQNQVMQNLFAHVLANNSTLHVQGLVSPGGIHSHSEHLYAFIKAAQEAGIEKIAIHAFTDGRDTPPRSAAAYLKELEAVLADLGIGFIATVAGRFYAMDRDNNWHRLAQFEKALYEGEGNRVTGKPSEVLEGLYGSDALDEHLEPIVFLDDAGRHYVLESGDGIFIFNFRSDRVRMLTRKLQERAADLNVKVATMTEYDPSFGVPVAFTPTSIQTTLAAEISRAGLKQSHVAETEKFPHATYFLNGGVQNPHDGEEHVMLDSRKDVATHDLAPKMRAEGIAEEAVKRIQRGDEFIFINFANPDMVGHTGNVPAIIEALEEVDTCLSRVIDALLERGGSALVTADHGNAEVNIDPETGEKHTSHTINPVPCVLIGRDTELRDHGTLADLAPTVLDILELEKPAAMTGQSLIK